MICDRCKKQYGCLRSRYEVVLECKHYSPITNFERIKAMSVEEMAEFLKRVCIGKEVEWTMGGILRYLESEVQEDD